MKGLTAEEHEVLLELAGPDSIELDDCDPRCSIRDELIAQGRAVWIPLSHPIFVGQWTITPAGREALKLWPLVKAAMEGSMTHV